MNILPPGNTVQELNYFAPQRNCFTVRPRVLAGEVRQAFSSGVESGIFDR